MDNQTIIRAQEATLDIQARKAADEAAIIIVETAGYGSEASIKQQCDLALAMLTALTDSAEAATMLDASITFVLDCCPGGMVPTAKYRKAAIIRAGAL